MEIKKKKNYVTEGVYDFELINDGKSVQIIYSNNLDLYMILECDEILEENKYKSIDFDITKENYEVFEAFDILYNKIVYEILKENDRIITRNYNKLVDDDKRIVWISDDGPFESQDRLVISKKDEHTYRLTFIRTDVVTPHEYKNRFGISIRFRNSGSQYDPLNFYFMDMYNQLQDVHVGEHRQIYLPELEYQEHIKTLKK